MESICQWCKKDLQGTDHGIKGDNICPYCSMPTPIDITRDTKTDIVMPTNYRTVQSSIAQGYAKLRYTPRDPKPNDTDTTL